MPGSQARTAAHAKVRRLLKESGLRSTPAREAVMRFLSRAGRPLAHGEIAGAPGMDALDRVTLYRTLTALQEAGLAHRVQDKNGAWRFCAHAARGDGCPGNHPHFLCTRCGTMRCLLDQPLPWVTVRKGEQVVGKQMVVYGLCSACAAG
jgi:Fur family ferric uptake transcriptional regulator